MLSPTLSGIATTGGRALSIEQAARTPEDARAIAGLRDDGFDRFIHSDRNIVDLMAEAITKGLARNDLPPENIDALVFATESFWDTDLERYSGVLPEYRRIRDGLLETMETLGLRNAYPYANWLSSCANLVPTIALAKGLVDAGQYAHVLVVVADKQPDIFGPLMENKAAVYSDMAVCCTVDRREAGYRIKQIVTHAAPVLATMRTADASPNFVLETSRAVKALGRKFRAQAGRSCGSYRHVLTNNYHLYSLKIICDALEIDESAVRRNVRAKIAHGHAGDPLITLQHLSANGLIDADEEVLLLSTGLYCWNLMALRPTGF